MPYFIYRRFLLVIKLIHYNQHIPYCSLHFHHYKNILKYYKKALSVLGILKGAE